MFTLIAVLFCCIGIFKPVKVEAATPYGFNMVSGGKVSAGGATFTAIQYKSGDSYYFKIVMKKNGRKKTLATKAGAEFATNGSILYYVKTGSRTSDYRYRNTIYRYVIKTGKATKVTAGLNYTICGCSGDYLYYGIDNWADGVKLYALNVKTKKKKYMTDGVGRVYISGKTVVTSTNSGDVDNYPIHSFQLNGSGKKKIDDGILLKVKNGKIYYCRYRYTSGDRYKVYTCLLNGKNKKAVTGWVSKIPAKYR